MGGVDCAARRRRRRGWNVVVREDGRGPASASFPDNRPRAAGVERTLTVERIFVRQKARGPIQFIFSKLVTFGK